MSGDSEVGVEVVCGAKLDLDLLLDGLVRGSCNLAFNAAVWSFAMDGEDVVFEVSPAFSDGTVAASSWLWRSPWLVECITGTDAGL